MISGSYAVKEDLPANVTDADLLASTSYVAAKKTGLANALVIAVADITISGFVIASSRRMQGRNLAEQSVTTNYEIAVVSTGGQTAADVATALETKISDPTTATAIQTQTNTAMSAADWSSDATFTTAPQLTETPTVAAPVSAAATGVITSGTFTLSLYSDSACTTAATNGVATGAIGTCLDNLSSGKIKVTGCTSTDISAVSGSTCSALSDNDVIAIAASCTAVPDGSGNYYTAACGSGSGSPADAATSDASLLSSAGAAGVILAALAM